MSYRRFVYAALVAAILAVTTSSAVALRYATPAERVSMIYAWQPDTYQCFPPGADHDLYDDTGEPLLPCVCFEGLLITNVSTVDRRYGTVVMNNQRREAAGCGRLIGDGYLLLRRSGKHEWARVGSYSWEGAPCGGEIRPRLALDLVSQAGSHMYCSPPPGHYWVGGYWCHDRYGRYWCGGQLRAETVRRGEGHHG